MMGFAVPTWITLTLCHFDNVSPPFKSAHVHTWTNHMWFVQKRTQLTVWQQLVQLVQTSPSLKMEKHPSKSLLAIMVMSGCDFLCLTACRCQTQMISRTVLWGIWRGAYRLWKETKLAQRQKPGKIIRRDFSQFHSLKRLWSTLLVLPQVVFVNCKRVFV